MNKHIILFAVASLSLLAISCENESRPDGNISDAGEPATTRSLKVKLTPAELDTKTTLIYSNGNDKTSTLVWANGDKVSCFIKEPGATEFGTAKSHIVSEDDTISLPEVPAAEFDLRIVYPAVEEGASFNEQIIADEQTQFFPDQFSGSNLPLLAESRIAEGLSQIDLTYDMVGAVIRLRLSSAEYAQEIVEKIVFGDNLNSKFYTLKMLNTDKLETAKDYYLVVPTGNHDFSISIYTDKSLLEYSKNLGKKNYTKGIHLYTLDITQDKISKVFPLDNAGTANCYIVKESGSYSFNASIPGNGVTPDDKKATLDLSGKVDADVLWCTGSDLAAIVTDIKFIPTTGRIQFSVPQTFKRGNAIIVLYDKETKEIIWTWHIWANETVEALPFPAGVGIFHWMNQNLGATEAYGVERSGEHIIAKPEKEMMNTYGLLYQWGSKNPVIGTSIIGDNTNTGAEAEAFGDKTDKDYIANTAVFGNEPGVTIWTVKGSVSPNEAMKMPMSYFNNAQKEAFVDNNFAFLWNSKELKKTMYDPCPAGYAIPAHSNLMAINTKINELSRPEKCARTLGRMYHFNTSEVVKEPFDAWFPASGYRTPDGKMCAPGNTSFLWSNDAAGSALYFTKAKVPYLLAKNKPKSAAYSIRCIKKN